MLMEEQNTSVQEEVEQVPELTQEELFKQEFDKYVLDVPDTLEVQQTTETMEAVQNELYIIRQASTYSFLIALMMFVIIIVLIFLKPLSDFIDDIFH